MKEESSKFAKSITPLLILAASLGAGYFIATGLIRVLLPEQDTGTTSQIAFTPFTSKEEFKAYVQQSFSHYSAPFARTRAFDEAAPGPLSQGLGGGGEPDRFSGTNVQVQGVDEPDIVKTDGKHIYYSPNLYGYYFDTPIPLEATPTKGLDVPTLPAIPPEESDIRPPEPPLATTKIIQSFPVADIGLTASIQKTGNLLLYKNILIVISYTHVSGYDIADAKAPKELWTFTLENGHYVADARLHGDTLYLLANGGLRYDDPCPIMPLSKDGSLLTIPCTEIYHPTVPVSVDVTHTAFAIDPATGTAHAHLSFIGSGYETTLALFPGTLYVGYPYTIDTSGVLYDFFLTRAQDIVPAALVERIRKVRDYDISDAAKFTELQLLLEQYFTSLDETARQDVEKELNARMSQYLTERIREFTKTILLKIDTGSLTIAARGEIPGRLLNQFSLDEYQGYLRAATTLEASAFAFGFGGAQVSLNDISVLDTQLNIVGSVRNLGFDERIFSVRFVEDKGYLVTFRQIDPFFVLDLSQPENPQRAGELKIPGFSSYLHPITKDLILGIGQEESQVKISLFDVLDPRAPAEIAKYTLPNEFWSEILTTHHAFLLDAKHQVFFLPAGSSGYIFSYANNAIRLVKKLGEEEIINPQRALYIDDYMYILGSNSLIVLDETTWKKVKELTWEQ